VETAVLSGRTVLVDFTAAYCSICKVNKKVAFDTPEVVDTIMELGVVPLQGDHTTGDERIAAMLRKHNRTGVPLNLIYPAGRLDDPIVLRSNLTKQYLLEKLRQAGPSSAASPAAP
jgi:thiol:disulfide interchange protein DsbD